VSDLDEPNRRVLMVVCTEEGELELDTEGWAVWELAGVAVWLQTQADEALQVDE
jgi:hypothetical protein